MTENQLKLYDFTVCVFDSVTICVSPWLSCYSTYAYFRKDQVRQNVIQGICSEGRQPQAGYVVFRSSLTIQSVHCSFQTTPEITSN